MTPPSLARVIPLAGLLAWPLPAAAQTPVTPLVEVVLQGAAETGSPRGVGFAPRFTVSLGPDTSLDVGGLFTPSNTDRFSTTSSGTTLDAALRQRLWARHRWQIFGLVGISRDDVVMRFPGYGYDTSYGRVTVPPSRVQFDEWAAQVATAVQYEVHPRLALRADARFVVGERGAVGVAVGAVAPFGRGPQRPWDDQPDPVKEGLWIGAATGGATGGLLFGVMAAAFCEDESCVGGTLGAITVGAAMGAGVGGIIGAVVDSLIPARRRK